MKWSEVKKKFPDRIVLIEALKTTSSNNVRTVEEMTILSEFSDSMSAWAEYKKVHKRQPKREIYIFHTTKEKAEVVEQFFVGIRGNRS